jgi:hypothetical protein
LPHACAQLCATGRLLQRLGLQRALCATPLVSAAVLAVVCAVPSAAVVGVGEAARKVGSRLAQLPPETPPGASPRLLLLAWSTPVPLLSLFVRGSLACDVCNTQP